MSLTVASRKRAWSVTIFTIRAGIFGSVCVGRRSLLGSLSAYLCTLMFNWLRCAFVVTFVVIGGLDAKRSSFCTSWAKDEAEAGQRVLVS